MGTQQILLIVLSVLVVGAAVAVGITMFNTQSVNSNRQALIADLNNFAAQALAYYKTPATHAGGDHTFPADMDNLATYLGFSTDDTPTLTNQNGTYTIARTDENTIVITGVGRENGNDGTNPVNATCTIVGNNATPTTVAIVN